MLNPSTASINSGPRTKPGQASARSKSAQLARCGAKVLVSCWNPPTAIRAIFPPSPPRRTRPVTPSPHRSQPVSWRQLEQRGYCLAEYREILFYRKIETKLRGGAAVSDTTNGSGRGPDEQPSNRRQLDKLIFD